MLLFKLNKQKLVNVNEQSIRLEKDLQGMIENNLEQLFGYKLLVSELQLNNLRIDTLAYDEENKAFVILEYKKDRSFSVVDQGYSYLALLLNNKADFILEYNERNNKSLKKDSVDWSQSKVIFIANSFTPHQRNSINFKNLPIQLWEVKSFKDDLWSFEQIKPLQQSESIDVISADKEIHTITREVKTYTLEDHFKSGWENSRELYDELEEELLKIDNRLEVSPVKYYIGYKIGAVVLFDIKVFQSKLELELYRVQPKDLKDPEHKLKYKKDSYKFYNKHISTLQLKSQEDIAYAIFLAKQISKLSEEKGLV